MFRKIFAALGATMLIMASIGGESVASVVIVEGNVVDVNLTDANNYTSGSGDLTALGRNILNSPFTDVYSFNVQPGGLTISSTIQSIFEPPTGNEGIKNLTLLWTDTIGAQTLFHITGDFGLQCAAQAGCDGQSVSSWPALFASALAAGHATLTIAGSTFSSGGKYSLFLTAVPLPAAALLFGSAILGGGLMRRRKMIKKFGLPA